MLADPPPPGEGDGARVARVASLPDSRSQTALRILAAHPRPSHAQSHPPSPFRAMAENSRSPEKARGAERRETQELARLLGRPAKPPRHACEACGFLLRSRKRASRRSTCGYFSHTGPRFRAARLRCRQPAPGRRAVVPAGWSPGSPGLPLTNGEGRSRASGALPPSAPGIPGLFSGPSFRPAPPIRVTG
jgi:hypothetical protein